MSERHTRAVQEQSQIADLNTRHILEIIALDIGFNDEPAYTSLRKIAERARCAVNTARNRVQKCVDSGELIATKDGKYTLYNLNPNRFLCPSTQPKPAHEKPKTDTGKGKFVTADTLIQLEKRLYQQQETLYQSLYQKQEQLYQSLYQNIVSIVSTDQTSTEYKVREVLEKGKVCREDTRTRDTQTPSSYVDFNAMWGDRTPPDPKLLDFREKMKKVVCNAHKVDQVDDLYYIARGYDITADDIVRWFGPGSVFWYKVSHGKKDGLQPYVNNVANDISRAKAWEQAGSKMPALNGVTKEPVKNLKPVKTGLRL